MSIGESHPSVTLRSVPRELAGLRVMIAEDDPKMRELIASTLRCDGFKVTEIEDGDALGRAVATIADGAVVIDMLITDVRMPGKSGLEALPLLQRAAHLPAVLLITAFGEPSLHEAARRMGADAVLDKPFDLDDLRTVIWFLAKRAARERLVQSAPAIGDDDRKP